MPIALMGINFTHFNYKNSAYIPLLGLTQKRPQGL